MCGLIFLKFELFGLVCKPALRIELVFAQSDLELERSVASVVGSNGAKCLVCLDFLSLLDADVRKVAVNGHVFAVCDDDVVHTAEFKDGSDCSVKDSSGFGAFLSR